MRGRLVRLAKGRFLTGAVLRGFPILAKLYRPGRRMGHPRGSFDQANARGHLGRTPNVIFHQSGLELAMEFHDLTRVIVLSQV